VASAVALQQTMAQRNATLPDAHRIELRIGINLGDIITAHDDVHGEGVNVTARLVCAAGARRRRAPFAGLSRRDRAGGVRDTCAHLYAGLWRAAVGLWCGARRRRAAPRLCRGAAAAGSGAISPVAGMVGRLDALVPFVPTQGIERACSSAGPED